MKADFDIALQTYNSGLNSLVDSTQPYYEAIVKSIPSYIQGLVGDGYLVKGSCGQGYKTLNPWVCIFDTRITTTATYGLYIAYLFRADMSGFYLVLMQGITSFGKFGTEKYNVAREVSSYFKRKISDDYFSKDEIDLKALKNTMGYGYEATTILSKFYSAGSYTDDVLRADLARMFDIYKSIADSMGSNTYDSIMNTGYSNQQDELVGLGAAVREIEKVFTEPEDNNLDKLELVESIEPRKKTYGNIVSKAPKKIDYLKKAESDGKNGLKGEKLVLEYEREKVVAAGRQDLLEQIVWVAEENDTLGYDIKSFEFDEDGKEFEIHIEVKTTKSDLNTPFFITDNELSAIKNAPENYRIYRVSIKKDAPTLHIIYGSDFLSRFNITPCNYIASLEEKVVLVVAALIRKGDEVLIAKRSTGDPNVLGKWEFPGGKVRLGENEQEAIVREMNEEFEVQVTAGDVIAETSFSYPTKQIVLKLVECEYVSGEPHLNDHSEYAFVNKQDLKDYDFAPADIAFLDYIH